MGVSVSSSGGIYISINGNYDQFRQDLKEVRRLGTMAARDISEAMSGALSPRTAARVGADLAQSLNQARRSAQGFSADLSQFEDHFKNIGRQIGIAEENLKDFADLQSRAFRNRAQQDFQRRMKDIQRQTGMTDEEMQRLAQSLGGTFETGRRGARDLSSGLRDAQREAQSMGNLLSRIGPTLAAIASSYVSFQGIGKFVSSGIESNRQLQDAEYGIATVLALNNKIIDAQGRELSGQQKFNAALQESVRVVKALDGATANASAEFTDLLRAFQSSVGAAQSRGLNWKQNIEVVTLMSNAMKAMNVDMQRLDSEVLAFLTGKNMDNSQVRQNLGLKPETIRSWGQGEEFVKKFITALGQSKYAGEAMQKSFSVATAAVKENLQSIAADMTKPLFDSVAQSADTFANSLYEIDKVTGTFRVKENIQPIVDVGRELAEVMGKGVVAAINNLTSALEGLGRFIKEYGGGILSFFRGIANAVSFLAGGALDGAKAIWKTTKDIVGAAKEAAQGLGKKAFTGLMETFYPEVTVDLSKTKIKLPNISEAMGAIGHIFNKGVSMLPGGTKFLATGAAEQMQKVVSDVTANWQKEQNKLINTAPNSIGKPKGSGSGSINAALNAISSLESKVKSLHSQLESNKGQGFLVQLDKELAGYERNLSKATESTKAKGQELIAQARELGKQIVAEQNLDTQAEFWRNYAVLTGRSLEESVQAHERALQKQVEVYRNAGVEMAAIEEWLRNKRLEYATDFSSGAQRALRDYARESQDAAKNAAEFMTNSFSSIEDSLASFVTTGKLEFKSLVDSIIADLARMAIKQTITGPLSGALSGVLGGLFGSASLPKSSISPTTGMPGFFASGGVFPGGTGLEAHVNSIVTRPTPFTFAKGGVPNLGIMGEKMGSPGEAILPLARTGGGDLGVKAMVGGGMPNIEINIIDQRTADSPPVEVQQSQTADGNMRIDVIVRQVENAISQNIMRGNSPIANSLDKTRGLNPHKQAYWRN